MIAFAGKFEIAKMAKANNLDAIHDTVHEMAKDEARHGRAFQGFLDRYLSHSRKRGCLTPRRPRFLSFRQSATHGFFGETC